jgi:Zn-dependent alcohol dehydrogenase
MAERLGATRYVNVRNGVLADVVAEATHERGADAVLLTLDAPQPEHFSEGVDLLGPGGILVQVGLAGAIESLPVSPRALMSRQRSITGTLYGGMDHARDALRYLDLYRAGRMPIDLLITQTYAIEEINDAFDDLAAGRNIRGVVRYI